MKKSLLISFALVLALVTQVWAQSRTVTGRVTDAQTGEGMPGVTVQLKGSTTAVPTDVNGSYSVPVPNAGGTLVFSFIGYSNQEIAVGSQSTINVRLATDARQISEVVVTGYGAAQEKREVTGAITSIKGEVIEGLPIQTFDKAIQGRAAGVQVTNNSGQPGAGVTINIRGTSTINGSTQPLYVIDGVQVSPGGLSGVTSANVLSSINPADIESIEILKDAAAASIYGSQAGNGVVIVTTKRGKAGKTNIRASAQLGYSEMISPYDLLSTEQYVDFNRDAYGNQLSRNGSFSYAEGRNRYDIARFGAAINPADLPNTDWYKEISQIGKTQQYELSVSGGDEKTRFFLSSSLNNSEGTVINSKYVRGTIRANLDHKITNKVSVETSLGLTGARTSGPTTDAGFFTNTPFTGSLLTPPYLPVYNEDGTFRTTGFPYGTNLVQSLTLEERTGDVVQSLSNIAINYDILPGLRFRTLAGIDFSDIRDHNYRPGTIPIYAGGTGSETFRRNINWTSATTLNYNKKFNEIHNVGVLGGFEYRSVTGETVSASGTGFANPLFTLLSQAATPSAVGATFTGYKIASYFGNFKYDYKSKYLASATVRYDGSSRFGASNKFGLFYGLSAGWRITGESFMENVQFLSDLKIRASYGVVGVQPQGNFASLGIYSGVGQYLGAPSIRPTQLAQPGLTWEQSAATNLGLDFALFNNRVYGSFDIYKKKTTDLILDRQLPGDAGITSITENGGEIEAKGIDFEITTVNIDKGGFKWNTSFNIGLIENKLVSLNAGRERIGNTYIVGEPLNLIYTTKWAGVNPADGRPMYYDLNNNLTYSPLTADQRIVGDQNADFFGGLTNTISYKGFTIDALFQYQYGNEAFTQTAQLLETGGFGGDNLSQAALQRWTTPGQITWVPRAYQTGVEPGGINPQGFSSRYVETGSYIRLKQVSLNYMLPSALTQRINLPSVSLFVQAMNLATFTNYRGDDPENNGQNLNQYPNPRTVTGGITLQF